MPLSDEPAATPPAANACLWPAGCDRPRHQQAGKVPSDYCQEPDTRTGKVHTSKAAARLREQMARDESKAAAKALEDLELPAEGRVRATAAAVVKATQVELDTSVTSGLAREAFLAAMDDWHNMEQVEARVSAATAAEAAALAREAAAVEAARGVGEARDRAVEAAQRARQERDEHVLAADEARDAGVAAAQAERDAGVAAAQAERDNEVAAAQADRDT
ncbi:MAG: hypothetical protein QG597_2716, partial [Actinomycetota bacterium]|nr:hypothetical protein [Actinomycetota bacterium]